MVNPQQLCMGCMEDRGSAATCSRCGWQEGSSADSSMQLQPRTVLNNRYLLGRVLGQGGYGITYLSWDLFLEGKRAIKEYFPGDICSRSKDERTVKLTRQRQKDVFEYGVNKFVEEGKALERFKEYPGIVKCLDFFYANETAYLVMEFMDGLTFSDYLKEHGGKIPFQDALNILIHVMDALREVHAVGMQHRDVAPNNIFIKKNKQVKLFDFGSTRFAVREQTQNISDAKLGYSPLEIYSSGAKQGPWTDVYSTGATLYSAITGQPPPPAFDRLDKDDLRSPRQLGINMPNSCETALLKALAVRPTARIQTVLEFQKAIAPDAFPPPPPPPPPPPLRYNPVLKAVLAVLALFLLLLIVFVSMNSGHSDNPPPPFGGYSPNSSLVKEKIDRGDLFMRSFDYCSAIKPYKDAQILDPQNADLPDKIGDAQRKCDAVRNVFGPVAPEVKINIQDILQRAMQARRQGKYDEAIAAYDEILKIDPNSRDAQDGRKQAVDAKKIEQSIGIK
jgi:serine/threonine protein kinase